MSKTKILDSKLIYKGNWLTLKRDKIVKPDGSVAIHEILLRNNGVIVIAILDNKFVMTKMYRYPVNDYSLEFPMGFIEKGESSLFAAKRELREEVGLIPEKIIYIGKIWAWSGLMTQHVSVYHAAHFKKVDTHLENTESDLKSMLVSKSKLNLLIRKNKIKNSATLAAYQLWNLCHGKIYS